MSQPQDPPVAVVDRQLKGAMQVVQLAPPRPQASLFVPEKQLPLLSQHPLQLLELQPVTAAVLHEPAAQV